MKRLAAKPDQASYIGNMTLRFDNSYARLPGRFYARQAPAPVPVATLVALNDDLARRLGADPEALRSPESVAWLAGNGLPDGAEPLAQAYAGHQFGGWVPQLGDGRAVLLGEVIAPDGARFDLQLKGAGQTPYSRQGDGRAWLGPVLREYVVSEAMAALGVPTTRALAAVTTGDTIWRDGQRRPGAVLARVAASHIRVGTFQYFAARRDIEGLQLLVDHVIARHHPQADGAAGLLDAVISAQARLIAQWMALGFIHGVMNTDNMTVSGETIDYGPCAFMDAFHPDTVYSSIDRQGRYAWSNQPQIAAWNLAQLAMCLIPVMGEETAAVQAATDSVHRFKDLYEAEWLKRFAAKIGIAAPTPEDLSLVDDLLAEMTRQGADFTNSFRGLIDGTARGNFADPAAFHAWADRWRARLASEADPEAVMRAANPAYIPRNHQVEAMISAAVAGDLAPFHRLNAVLSRPYDTQQGAEDLALPPRPDQVVQATFCGT